MTATAGKPAGTAHPVVRMRGLRRSYRGTPAVAGVDLDVAAGEVVCLLGPNGAGKTTTVEILEGYRHRDAGEVSVLGTDPAAGGPAWRARIGIVPQTATDLPELTVTEVVSAFAGYYPRPRDTEEVIALVGLTAKGGARVRELSGGQRRRLDVALGLVGDPELMFLDEPTTGFDPQARRQFWTLVRRLAADGTTVLLTTHYLDEAEALADRIAVLAAGRLLDVASPDRLGGRAAAPAEVAWTGPSGAERVRTHEPARVVADLVARTGGEPADLTVTRPSLEDVYLDMIGAVA